MLTLEHQQSAKNVPVIPRFSPLARARILPCPKEKQETARSLILKTPFR